MIKKIKAGQVAAGMFIHDMNCGWMEHPFVRNQFKISSEEEIRKIGESGIREVYIDTDKGLDVADAQTAEEVNAEIESRLQEMAEREARKRRELPMADELPRARQVQSEANRIVHSMLSDVRLGKQIEVERVQPVVEEITDSIFRNKDALISLCRIKNKDDYTFMHSVSVGTLLISFCRSLELGRDAILPVGVGGLLHDLGKMKIPGHILNKPGKLTDEEFAVMKSHVVHSRAILDQTPGISQVSIEIASQHHEREDGGGYPLGLRGEEMSEFGKMAAIVDVYDALTSERCYHKGMEPTVVLRKLFEWSKYHFDAKLVNAFIHAIGIYPVGTLVQLESGRLGVVIEQHAHHSLQPRLRIMYDAKKQCYLPPQEVDLSAPLGSGGADRIIAHEPPAKWGIDINRFL